MYPKKEQLEQLLRAVIEKTAFSYDSNEVDHLIKENISRISFRWEKSRRKMDSFTKHNEEWLQGENSKLFHGVLEIVGQLQLGRPKKSSEEKN